MTAPVPPTVLEFARDLTAVLAELRSDLVGVYLHSSGALGGLILHCAVCRDHAVTVAGPPPQQVFGEIGRDRVVQASLHELDWALGNAPTTYAVLNACRALRFAVQGVQCSKVEAGSWYLERHPGNPVVLAALADQRGATTPPPAAKQTEEFVRALAARLLSL